MKYLLVLFLLINFSLAAQSNKQIHEATYVRVISYNNPAAIDTISLFFNTHSALFVRPAKKAEEKSSTKVNEEDMSISINISLDTEEDYVLFTNLKTKTIITRETVYAGNNKGAVAYLVKEKIKTPQWKIFSEQKHIGKFMCTKAKTNFRGRDYTVWFTEDIKTHFGPWKLGGLPGLILEASDESGNYSYFLIKYNNRSNFQKILKPSGNKEISLKEYRKLADLQVKNIVEHIRSKLPRGSTFTVDSIEKSDNQELEFEWEK